MKLILGDSLHKLRDLPTGTVDAVVTDPPYGIGLAEWDKTIPSADFFEEIFRVSKNQIIFGGNYFDLKKTESWVVWYKQPFLPNQAQAELIWTSFKFKPKVLHYRYAGNCEGYPDKLKVNYKKKSVHPAEKPVAVMEWIIEQFTKPGDIVLDPFMGSGSTGVACKNLGRLFIGIEKDEKYFAIAKERIASAGKQSEQKQLDMEA